VAGVVLVVGVGVGGVQQAGARIERGVDDVDRARLVARLRGRQAQAAEADQNCPTLPFTDSMSRAGS
jgi:hypothetical protein